MSRKRIYTDEERRIRRNASALRYHHRNKERENALNRERWRKIRGCPQPSRPEPTTCELCGGPPTGRGGKHLHLDHNHVTGVFRGWLCSKCNQALGLLKDSSDLCIAAARYLRTSELI